MYCIHCGAKLKDTANFCSQCGAKVTGEFRYMPREDMRLPIPKEMLCKENLKRMSFAGEKIRQFRNTWFSDTINTWFSNHPIVLKNIYFDPGFDTYIASTLWQGIDVTITGLEFDYYEDGVHGYHYYFDYIPLNQFFKIRPTVSQELDARLEEWKEAHPDRIVVWHKKVQRYYTQERYGYTVGVQPHHFSTLFFIHRKR